MESSRPQSFADHFTETAEEFADQYQAKACFRDRLELFVAALQRTTPAPAPVLDYGCGPGVMSLTFAKLGYEVTGLDGAPGMVDLARRRQKKLNLPNASFELMPADRVALPPEKFSAVVCSSVIEYIPDDSGLVRSLVSALKPGGHLLISVPHTPSLGAVAEGAVRKVRDLRKTADSKVNSLYLRRYRRAALLKRLEQLGLAQLNTTTFELPRLGRLGVGLSRIPLLGIMMLVVGRKTEIGNAA
jgi:2-polyprenyl-3-methyl-5-hydroxy-6-metoxy-1,4-benzoquinol methylase